jgi:glycosyltransferase involved in cell wall biosynthesis
VIWRTVGQSVEGNEAMMAPLRRDGLQIVRYSPKERNIPGYAGEDALIRFWKDPEEWTGWVGDGALPAGPDRPETTYEGPWIANITQHLAQREPYTNHGFWEAATAGLPVHPAGPGSEVLRGGLGELDYDAMREYLRRGRAYVYTGTQPASYTLGLIEAMMTGIPVVSIGPSWMRIFPYGPDLFEGHEITTSWLDDPGAARELLNFYLHYPDEAKAIGDSARKRAIELFGKDTIALQWAAFLGGGMTQADVERRLAGAAA